MTEIKIDAAGQVQPLFVYQRVILANFLNYSIFTVPYGYAYWLRFLVLNYPRVSPPQPTAGIIAPGMAVNPDLSVEFYTASKGITGRQVQPIPAGLFSSPGGNSDPVESSIVAGAVTATKITSNKPLNYLYRYGETVQLQITGQNTTNPRFVDVLLEGYLLPWVKLAMWGGGIE